MATVVITGANRGIGLELTKNFLKAGHQVVAACRKSSSELESTGAQVVDGVDVATSEGRGKLVSALEGQNVDVLVNNAGIMLRTPLGDITEEALLKQFQVNSMAPLLLTQALLPFMSKGGKVGIVTSRMGSMEDNTSGGAYGYRMSKAAVNAAGKSLAEDLRAEGIAVAILHPGWVKTEMTGGTGNLEASVAASNLFARMEGLNMDNTGTFWHSNGEVLPW